MDKVSPDFGLTVVETRSWTDGDCDQVDDHNIDISTSSPGAFTTSCHIAEAHSVVDVNSIALDDGCAPTEETDCSVAEVFTPRISAKLEDVSSKSTLSSPCDPAETAALPSPSCNIGADGLVKAVEPIQPNASADAIPSPMLFGSFVAPGKADPNIVVQLEGADLWHQFYQAGTEMIITKSGRRMFPGIVTTIVGLESDSKYIVSLEVNPSDNHRYKYINAKWVVVGKAESHCEEMLKYVHPDSPASGRHWTSSKVSFKKIKVTNSKNKNNKRGQVSLNSMHRYTPRVVIAKCTSKKSSTVVYTLDLHECSFIAVTAYQNDQVTQLKIDHNPFAKAFRENPGDSEMYGYGGMMGSWPPISPLLSPYGNGFPDPQGIPQGMISPGIVPPPGPSPLPHFGTAFGNWESPPFSPNSYRQLPAPGLPSPAAPISPLVSGFPAPNSRPHFQPGFTSGYHVSGSPVGYGSNFSAAPVHIQAPNLNLKVPITNSDQGSAFMVPKMEHPRSANNSPHMAMD